MEILELSYACLAEKVWLFMFLFPPRAESSEWREFQTANASSVGASTIQVKYNRHERDAETEVLPENAWHRILVCWLVFHWRAAF